MSEAQSAIIIGMEERITALEAALRETLPFFRSVIQGGEKWTPTCETAYNRAMSALTQTEDTGEQDAADVLGDVPGFNMPRQTEETPDE